MKKFLLSTAVAAGLLGDNISLNTILLTVDDSPTPSSLEQVATISLPATECSSIDVSNKGSVALFCEDYEGGRLVKKIVVVDVQDKLNPRIIRVIGDIGSLKSDPVIFRNGNFYVPVYIPFTRDEEIFEIDPLTAQIKNRYFSPSLWYGMGEDVSTIEIDEEKNLYALIDLGNDICLGTILKKYQLSNREVLIAEDSYRTDICANNVKLIQNKLIVSGGNGIAFYSPTTLGRLYTFTSSLDFDRVKEIKLPSSPIGVVEDSSQINVVDIGALRRDEVFSFAIGYHNDEEEESGIQFFNYIQTSRDLTPIITKPDLTFESTVRGTVSGLTIDPQLIQIDPIEFDPEVVDAEKLTPLQDRLKIENLSSFDIGPNLKLFAVSGGALKVFKAKYSTTNNLPSLNFYPEDAIQPILGERFDKVRVDLRDFRYIYVLAKPSSVHQGAQLHIFKDKSYLEDVPGGIFPPPDLLYKDFKLMGYFYHYGSGAFDWLYITPSGFIAKLEGIDPSTKKFKWEILTSKITAVKINKSDPTSPIIIIEGVKENAPSYLKTLEGKPLEPDGYFFHYGDGPFDWFYLTRSQKYLAKLEGLTPEGKFEWKFIQNVVDYSFDGEVLHLGGYK